MNAERPIRRKGLDFAGREFSLPDGANAWHLLYARNDDANLLILGLGPYGKPPFAPQPGQEIFWLDAPQTLRQLQISPPSCWREARSENMAELAKTCSVYFYKPALRLAPQFWSPILASIDLAVNPLPHHTGAPVVWLPGNDNQLLHQELKHALHSLGFAEILEAIPGGDGASSLARVFAGAMPQLAICVNFRGMDKEGRIFAILRELQIPLGIWLVDNPWNLLAGIPMPWWQDAHIFMTDASFIAPLQAYGARYAHFLPLAGSPHMGNGVMSCGGWGGSPLFVGRSAFPDKAGFFAGVKLNQGLWQEAVGMLAKSVALPDFHWWARECGQRLWPGKGGRLPALGAEDCSRLRRATWLKAAIVHGLRIVGDAGWREIFPRAAISPPVDYYGSLPCLYGEAECCLNVTSLLLPQSLSQRHFDVWLAGGFLLSDPTPGLNIFPPEIVQPMRLSEPGDFARKLMALRQNPAGKMELARAWQAEILTRHLYQHRIEAMIVTLSAAMTADEHA